jgi:phenylacetic acid degradation operon negative regulatory protein
MMTPPVSAGVNDDRKACPLNSRSEFLGHLRLELADGTRPQQMLVTLMADYWFAEGALAPSGTLVSLMEEFGVSSSGTRTLLGRLTHAGRLNTMKEGRRTFYGLTPASRERLGAGLRDIVGFGRVPDPEPVIWTCLAFSIPEHQRSERQKLRKGLAWLGFAPLYDGVWISPLSNQDKVHALLNKLEVESATLFEATAQGIGRTRGLPTDAWDIPRLRQYYEEFLRETGPLLGLVERGDITASAALVLRTELINVWRCFPRFDPHLPLALLPSPWPRSEASEVFRALYDKLEPLASSLVRHHVESHSPEHVDDISTHLLSRFPGSAEQSPTSRKYLKI